MRTSLKRLFPLLIILSFALSLHAQETVKILRVVDGDTLKINYKGKQESIRLIGIDAPESRVNPKAKRECPENWGRYENHPRHGEGSNPICKYFG